MPKHTYYKNIMCLVNINSLTLRCGVFTKVKFLKMNLCEKCAVMSVSRALNIASLEKEKPHSIVGVERVQIKYGI